MDCSMPGLPGHHQLQEPTQTYDIMLVMPSNHLILCRPLLPPSNFPSIRVFSNESVLPLRRPKYWSFSFSIHPSNEYSEQISFLWLTGWISLHSKGLSRVFSSTTVQKHQFLSGQLFFIFQLSHPYMTTGKTVALTIKAFVRKMMSLLFNILSRLVIVFLPKSKSFNFMAAVTICSDFWSPRK